MWKCPYCETYSPEEAAFCVACGQPRTAPSIQTPQGQGGGRNQQGPVNAQAPAYAPAGAAPAPAPKKKGKTALLIGGIVLGLALIALGLWFLLGRTHCSRLVSTQLVQDGISTQTVTYLYSADGKTVTAQQVIDGKLRYQATGTVDKTGAFVTMIWTDLDGEITNRYEYENDKYGNHLVTRRYNGDGILVQLTTSEYNAYRIVEKQVVTNYGEGGKVVGRTIMEFSDRTNGLYYREDENGQRELAARYVRTYNDKNQLILQISYDPDDGNEVSRVSYVRDADYYPLSYTSTPINGSPMTVNYQWERVR